MSAAHLIARTRALAPVLGLIAAFAVAACGASTPPATAGAVATPGGAGSTRPDPGVATAPAALPAEVDVAGAAALQAAGAFVLDVREPDEWAAGHIDGATLIPLGQLAARVAEVPAGRSVVVVCRSGNRSAQGRDVLLGAGHPSATSMAGGMTAWAAAGNPVATGP